MAERKFYKDLTPGEIKYLSRNANGIDLKRFSDTFLQQRDDGTYRFDEMSDAQRSAIFKTLDLPNVKQFTAQYNQEWYGIPKTDRKTLIQADVAPPAPEPVAIDDPEAFERRRAYIARLNALLDEIKIADEEQDIPPSNVLVVGELTEADRAIPMSGEPAVLRAINLTADQQALVDADAGKRINLIAFVDQRPPVNSETLAAKDRSADYTRLQQRQTEADLIAAEQLALGPTERTNGLRIVDVNNTGVGTIIATDNNGLQYVLNRDTFEPLRNSFSALVQEEENQLRYFRTWAQEQGRSQADIDRVVSAPNGLILLESDRDYQRNLADIKAETGKLPFATPASDRDLTTVGLLAESAQAQNARTNPVGGAAGDKVESTGGGDTAVPLTDAERARLSSASALEELKRTAIENGTKPIATPTIAASQSAVASVEVDASGNASVASSDGSSSTSTKPTVVTDSQSSSQSTETQAVQNNPLDEYESYTYGLALHVLDKKEHDRLAQNSKNWRPTHTLIASAGRWQESGSDTATDYLKREEGWEDNFFFENLKMTQLQAPSVTGRSTNTTDMEFTIIEPYGLTLLDRMIRTANKLKSESYMHLCYMLQIDFFDSEKGLLIEHRKYLPITLTGMNIKVSGKGSQYVVTAVPFHYKALMESVATTPLDVDVISSTLRDFFADQHSASASAGAEGANAGVERELKAAQAGTPGNLPTVTPGDGARVIAFRGQAQTEKNYEIHSYVAAYNGWWQKMKDLNATDPKVAPQNIKVRFADEIIKQETLTKPVTGEVASGPMARPNSKQGQPVAENTTHKGFAFKAGTNIIEVINTAMMSSEYIRSQVLIANKEESATGPKKGEVRWWKVLPQVRINDFDNTLNRWSYSIIYFVVPYKVWNTKHPNLPKSNPRRANCVKQYNYLYTGDNRSVIDFQVEFDMLYFTTVAGFKQINIDGIDRKQPDAEAAGVDSNDRGASSNSITPVVHKLVPHDVSGSHGNNLTQDPKAVALGTIQNSIYSGVNGEMLTVTVKIIGDPTLVKQDDLFINIGHYYDEQKRSATSDGINLTGSHHGTPKGDNSLNNNSIVTDAGEVLAWVQVLMPPDIDENTGGLKLGAGASSVNSFTGVYKILEVQNEFSQGKFIQTLILIRYQEQEADRNYREALSADRERVGSAESEENTSLARTADSETDTLPSPVVAQSSQVASPVNNTSDETLTQTASTVLTPTQFNLLDTGNYPESVIEKTDLA